MDRLLNASGRNANLHSGRHYRPFPVVLALRALTAAVRLCGLGARAAAPNADSESRELRIVLEGTSISARTPEGRILFSGRAGQDDAAIVQRAVDHVHLGGAPIIFVGDDGKAASRNIRVHGNVFPEGLASLQAISVSALSAHALQPP
jgi:hypothetical protein